MQRRLFLRLAMAPLLLAAACSSLESRESLHPPIVFVHGAGGDASRWTTVLWRFESNGWPRDRLFAIDVIHPLPRNDDSKPQPRRTSAAEHAAQVAAEVERVRKVTGMQRVVLVANSRGGLAVRDFIRNGAGRTQVSHAILGGVPNHGLWKGTFGAGHEANADGAYLAALNSPQGPDSLEVTPGVAFMTLRSDKLDKYFQGDGRALGRPQMKTGLLHDAPELRGARNVVLPGADHLEVSYGPEAFAQTYLFITGNRPARTDIVREASIVLDGKVTAVVGNEPTNLPIADARIEVYEVAAATGERLGGPVHAKNIAADGLWGPFSGRSDAFYEFVVSAPGYATTHTYRSPFPRSSSVVNFRPSLMSDAYRRADSIVVMLRPRGFLGVGRDRMSLDGEPPPGITPGVPTDFFSILRLTEPAMRSVVAELNGERIVVRTWPTKENRVVRAEFHY